MVDYDGVTRTFNDANQMTSDGTNTLSYDNNGNLTAVGSDTYVWDRANRLLSVGNHSYVYDGLGNRVQQTVSSVVTDYLNDLQPGLTKLLKQDDGTNVEHFVHAPRGIHAVDDGTDWNFYAQDGLGSVRAVVDDSGVVQSSMSYDPYGNPMASYGDGFGFTGEQTDADGSVFLRARYYEPSLGVFNALDPWEGVNSRPMSLNGYSWVEGNVPNFADPTGMTCQCEVYRESGDLDLYVACITNPNNQHPTSAPQLEPRFYDSDTSPLVFEGIPPAIPWLSGDDTIKSYETFRAISQQMGRSLSYEETFALIFAQELLGVIFSTYWDYWGEDGVDSTRRPLTSPPYCTALPCAGVVSNIPGESNHQSRTMRLMITQVVARQFWGKCRTNRAGKPCSIQEFGEFLSHNVQWRSGAAPEVRAQRVLDDFEAVRSNSDYQRLLPLSSSEVYNPPETSWRNGIVNGAPSTWGNYTNASLSDRSFGFGATDVVAVNYEVGVSDVSTQSSCPWVLLTPEQRGNLGIANCVTN